MRTEFRVVLNSEAVHGTPTREYPCSASVFKQGTLVVGVAIPGAVFGEALSINYRIPLVLLASRKVNVVR